MCEGWLNTLSRPSFRRIDKSFKNFYCIYTFYTYTFKRKSNR